MANADRCICCGEIIPEGRQVCPRCEGAETAKPLSQEEYFFYEWLILEKGITEESIKQLGAVDWVRLTNEYNRFKHTLGGK